MRQAYHTTYPCSGSGRDRCVWLSAASACWALLAAAVACNHGDPQGASVRARAATGAGERATVAAEEPEVARASKASAPEPPAPPPSGADAGSCPKSNAKHVGILVTPERPRPGQPLRIIVATLAGESRLAVRLEADSGEPKAALMHRAGVPATTVATIDDPKPGVFEVVVGRDGEGLACARVKVEFYRDGRPARDRGSVWPSRRAWDGAEEALFSAWVRELFSAPRAEDLAWSALHEVTSDRDRNLLHDHHGLGEDDSDSSVGLYLKPDCADTPYFLRAYYAWKRSLPFGFRKCSRGRGKAPACGRLLDTTDAPDGRDARKGPGLDVVQHYFRRTLAWGVHTGNGRTAFADDRTDFYPVELTRKALRPGIIYADPYGHIFVLVEMMSAADGLPGVLYAIDGQPDGSITRKRFWEGNFLWNPDPSLGGSGFKAFRPIEVVDGRARALTDAELESRPGYGDVSSTQAELDADEFYDRMDALVTPGFRDPHVAQEEAVTALFEAAKVRATSVHNGDEFVEAGGRVSMPSGFAIFETTGAWENYSTPARDLRILIAIDVVTGFAKKVARNADVFVREGESLKDLRKALAKKRRVLLDDPKFRFDYTRSDGSSWTLSVADVVDRAEALEMGYNPNDCPELRWGAPAGSKEARTCRRHAPTAQRKKMAAYRPWFAKRRRPARGESGPPVD